MENRGNIVLEKLFLKNVVILVPKKPTMSFFASKILLTTESEVKQLVSESPSAPGLCEDANW